MPLTEYTFRSDPDNALFLERLDAFVQKSLADIEAFAERESMSFQETRRYVAEWHVKFLFGPTPDAAPQEGEGEERLTRVRNTLIASSSALESLAELLGVQSFLLAVDPHNPQDAGFLGGSLIGREFYRGLRGGGDSGATTFKTYAQRRLPLPQEEVVVPHEPVVEENPPPPTRSARQAKIDLYQIIRLQLRKVSGIRKAEMKWTSPERLGLYGVQMVGWPPDIPNANPSALKANQNQKLLQLVESGELRFEKIVYTGLEASMAPDASQSTSDVAAEDFLWADVDGGGGDTALSGSSNTTSAAVKSLVTASPALSLDPMLPGSSGISPIEEDSLGVVSTWKGDASELFAAEREGGFDEYDFQPDSWNGALSLEEQEAHSPVERRHRKRRRSSGGEE